MSAPHTYRNDEVSKGMDLSGEWNEEAVVNDYQDGAEEDPGASAEYSMARDGGGYSNGYGGDTMEGHVNAYDSQQYTYRHTDGDAALADHGGSSFGTRIGTTMENGTNAASYQNDEYLEDYDQDQDYADGRPYDGNMMAQGNGGNLDTLDDQAINYYDGAEEEVEEEADDALDYEDEDKLDDIGEEGYEADGQAKAGGATVEHPIVQEVRVQVDERHNKMRSLTNKLLREMEFYVQTLVETEKTYDAVRQQEIAESDRLDRCEAQVNSAIAGLNFPQTQNEDEDDGSYQDGSATDYQDAQTGFQETETD